MLDIPADPASAFAGLRASLAAPKRSLATIFDVGERLLALDAAAAAAADVPTQRIAVLGSLTTDFILRAVACALAEEGVLAVLYEAPFGALVQDVLDPASALHRFRPDLVLLAVDWRDLVSDLPIGADAAAVDAAIAAKVALFERLWTRLDARILQHIPPAPPARFRGAAERLAPASPRRQVQAAGAALLAAGGGRVHWIDVAELAGTIGHGRFAAARLYHSARLPFDQKFLPDYMLAFGGAWRAANGRPKKVLALDLDSTIWGGVIGDDGVEGITLGPGSPAGEAFAEWQNYVRELGTRGVILAACSKNDPAIAATGLAHPASRLGRDDFAAFECSWNDKVEGLRRIAAMLNVGIDSIVFADDNPAECDLVRRELPEVAVVHLGTDPAQFIEILDRTHWLDLPSYTAEDLGRAAAYTARRQATEAASGAADIGAYLAGLAMVGRVWRPEAPDIARVAQLEQKTNQFNLTTRRHSRAAIEGFLSRDDAIVLAFRLADRFGDHGLVSALIALAEGADLHIDSWLMSCRVFSRSAEPFILRHLIGLARERGLARIIGEYAATAKNGVVADLYPRLGFTPLGAGRFARDVAAGMDDLATYIAEG